MDPRNETTIVEGALDEEDDDNDATQDQERGG